MAREAKAIITATTNHRNRPKIVDAPEAKTDRSFPGIVRPDRRTPGITSESEAPEAKARADRAAEAGIEAKIVRIVRRIFANHRVHRSRGNSPSEAGLRFRAFAVRFAVAPAPEAVSTKEEAAFRMLRLSRHRRVARPRRTTDRSLQVRRNSNPHLPCRPIDHRRV